MKQLTSILLLITSFHCFAEDASLQLDSTKIMYESGAYNEAKDSYLSIIDSEKESTELHYNLGDTYYKLGDLSRAILHFEKALKIDSENEDARFNLSLMNTKIIDKIEEKGNSKSYEKIITLLNQDTFALIGFIGFLLTLLLTLLFFKSNDTHKRRIYLNIGFIGILVFLLGTTGAFLNNQFTANNKQAIIMSPSLTVRSAPTEDSSELFVIHEGLKVRVLEIQDELAKIKLSDGNIGWVSVDSFVEI